MKPRVRTGYALKRLDASEGRKRWVLRDLAIGTFLRLSDNDAGVFQLLDGSHSLVELVGLSEQRYGQTGPARLARLLTDLGERGFLEGVAGGQPLAEAPREVVAEARQAAREGLRRASARSSSASTGRAAGCSSRGRC